MAVKTSVGASSLVEVLDRILDKGIVIDLFAIVSIVGIELITIEARVVIASVETWLTYARAVGLLSSAA
ncbi:MAG TPA: gas vesicle protein GvpJ [Bacillota bacterium]|nr:gas vesicle protein GvpJ [Bacillota bacterium]